MTNIKSFDIDPDIEVEKNKINKMSDEQVLRIWCNTDEKHPYFDANTDLGKCFAKRFGKLTLGQIRKTIYKRGVFIK